MVRKLLVIELIIFGSFEHIVNQGCKPLYFKWKCLRTVFALKLVGMGAYHFQIIYTFA